MSKAPYNDNFDDEDDLPPPYTASGGDAAPLSARLGSLRQQIDSEQATRSLSRDQIDSQTLAYITPVLEDVLSSIASIHPLPALVVTTFVPAGAVTGGWIPVEDNEDVRGELHKTVRISKQTKGCGDVKRPQQQSDQEQVAGREFDGWGRWQDDDTSSSNADGEGELWWSDEDMARRLARYMQPDNRPSSGGGRAAPLPSKEGDSHRSSALRLILDRVANRVPEPLVSGKAPAAGSSSQTQPVKGDVSLTVNAEEVTFRKENDFGLWESMTGWGIVARVRLGSR